MKQYKYIVHYPSIKDGKEDLDNMMQKKFVSPDEVMEFLNIKTYNIFLHIVRQEYKHVSHRTSHLKNIRIEKIKLQYPVTKKKSEKENSKIEFLEIINSTNV